MHEMQVLDSQDKIFCLFYMQKDHVRPIQNIAQKFHFRRPRNFGLIRLSNIFGINLTGCPKIPFPSYPAPKTFE